MNPDSYEDAAKTVANALELAGRRTLLSTLAALQLMDENADFDFDHARDTDPAWPTAAKVAATEALRTLRDTRDTDDATEEQKRVAQTAATRALQVLRNALEHLAAVTPTATPGHRARAVSLFIAAFTNVFADNPYMKMSLHPSNESHLAITGELDGWRMRFHPAEVSTFLSWLTRAVATDPQTIITVTTNWSLDGEDAGEGWAWCIAAGAALDRKGAARHLDDYVDPRGAESRHITLDRPQPDPSVADLSSTALTDNVKAVLSAFAEPSLPDDLAPAAMPRTVLDALSPSHVHDLLRYALCIYQPVAPCSPPTAERTADIMRRGRAFLTGARDEPGPAHTPDTVIRLNADAAVNHAVARVAGPAPAYRALRPAWETWRAAVHEHLLNRCRAVGIDESDAVRSAMTHTDYQRRTPGPLSDEVEALTGAGALWHHTPYGVFWTDPDSQG
ncbi:hypothetical protein ACFWGI_06205 [Streptomyces niveus]|uniref:hypothetical protein n=1 Tax=Streptomyces niveus TaxID=193462 RepID=UPI00364D253F